jgi:hypothetical protein
VLASGLLLITGMMSVPTRAITFHSAPRAPYTDGLGAPNDPTAPPTAGIRRTRAALAPRPPAPVSAPAPTPATPVATPAAPSPPPSPSPGSAPVAVASVRPLPVPSLPPLPIVSLPPLPIIGGLRIGPGLTITLGSGTPLLQLRLLPTTPRAQS